MHFSTLRLANKLRLPIFKNRKGEQAHSRHDGSDWDFAAWFAATVGELGEVAMCRRAFQANAINDTTYRREIPYEFADVVTYLDIMALRAFDMRAMHHNDYSEQELLMELIGHLGNYANSWKKFIPGDTDKATYQDIKIDALSRAMQCLTMLKRNFVSYPEPTYMAHNDGVNLENAVREKFNIVSERVKGPTIEQSSIGSDLIGNLHRS